MGANQGKCTRCYRVFPLNSDGNIPYHAGSVVGICDGTSQPPWRDPDALLDDSKDDFEIKITARGHPGTGRRGR